jgi:prephenate dehydratase
MTTRVGYLGPAGTFSHEALMASVAQAEVDPVPLPTIHETVMAVQEGTVESAIVPIENSIEGSVDITLDTLAIEAPGVSIVGEVVRPIRHCLIAAGPLPTDQIELVISHPQVIGQCARFLRSLPRARVQTASSTAEAVREVTSHGGEPWAALGNRLSAELYDARILREGVEDEPDNQTRFVWLAPDAGEGAGEGRDALVGATSGPGDQSADASWKTSLVFWGVGAGAPGWLVRCLTEFSSRDINLTRIESRPRRQGLGTYIFFADLEGSVHSPDVAEAIGALRHHADEVRVLGSYPAA